MNKEVRNKIIQIFKDYDNFRESDPEAFVDEILEAVKPVTHPKSRFQTPKNKYYFEVVHTIGFDNSGDPIEKVWLFTSATAPHEGKWSRSNITDEVMRWVKTLKIPNLDFDWDLYIEVSCVQPSEFIEV